MLSSTESPRKAGSEITRLMEPEIQFSFSLLQLGTVAQLRYRTSGYDKQNWKRERKHFFPYKSGSVLLPIKVTKYVSLWNQSQKAACQAQLTDKSMFPKGGLFCFGGFQPDNNLAASKQNTHRTSCQSTHMKQGRKHEYFRRSRHCLEKPHVPTSLSKVMVFITPKSAAIVKPTIYNK